MRTWDLDVDRPALGFVSGNQHADPHQAWVVGGLLTGVITPAFTPEAAYASGERFAGRASRDHQPWYQGRPDQIIFWIFMSLLMTGIAGYSIDVADWFGVTFSLLLAATSLVTLVTAVRVRNDPAWTARGVIARLQTHPNEVDDLAASLERDHSANPEAAVNLAALRYQQHRWREAADLYRRYLEAAPDDRLAVLRCADALLHAGNPDEAGSVLGDLAGVDADVRRQQRDLLTQGRCDSPAADAELPGYSDFSRYLSALSSGGGDAVAELRDAHPAHQAFQKSPTSIDVETVLDCTDAERRVRGTQRARTAKTT